MKEFNRNKFVKIVSADKNLGLCIFSIQDYDKMVHVHLSDRLHYISIGLISSSEWQQVFKLVCKSHAVLLKRFRIVFPDSVQTFRYLSDFKRKLPVFHVLPKLHKCSISISSRPIVGAVQWITTNWSVYLCSVLEKIACSYTIVNSLSLVSKVEFLNLSDDEFLVTADVSSLYTMMSLGRLFSSLRTKNVSDFDIAVADFVCNSNYFRYGSMIYKQVDGIAMGCNAAVHFANIYLDEFDHKFAPVCKFYCRYIDDLFFVWKGSEYLLQSLFNRMNAFIPGIKLNFSFSKSTVDFLDLCIFRHRDQLLFRTFQKPFNIYQYLPPFTFHNPACISGFIKGELIRFVRSNSLPIDRVLFASLFRKRLLARGYCNSYLSRIFNSVSFSDRRPVIRNTSQRIIPLVLPFYRNNITLRCKDLIRYVNQHFLEIDCPVKFLIAFKRNPNLFQLCSRSNISLTQEELLTSRNEDTSQRHTLTIEAQRPPASP